MLKACESVIHIFGLESIGVPNRGCKISKPHRKVAPSGISFTHHMEILYFLCLPSFVFHMLMHRHSILINSPILKYEPVTNWSGIVACPCRQFGSLHQPPTSRLPFTIVCEQRTSPVRPTLLADPPFKIQTHRPWNSPGKPPTRLDIELLELWIYY